MRLGIDGAGIRQGGGITHLAELLGAAERDESGIAEVVLWGGGPLLSAIEDRPWLRKVHEPLLDRGMIGRMLWQRGLLPGRARKDPCDVIFSPSGMHTGKVHPLVVMPQNLLPFESSELQRYRGSRQFVRLKLLRKLLCDSIRSADGVLFLSAYQKQKISQTVGRLPSYLAVIPHGVNRCFLLPPRSRADESSAPFKILYVSIIDWYKHQWNVAEAVGHLRRSGLPVELELVGPHYRPALLRLLQSLKALDPNDAFIRYVGVVPYAELPKYYSNADLFVFASSCESLPCILLEAMASGLPIACSNRGSMPELLADSGEYFDPEKPEDIAAALDRLIRDSQLRGQRAAAAFARAGNYTWERCAQETLRFLSSVASGKN
jgi:glycosyltransferase involved in cell wall biosynthesis